MNDSLYKALPMALLRFSGKIYACIIYSTFNRKFLTEMYEKIWFHNRVNFLKILL